MTYRIVGLDPAPFRPLFQLSDDQLKARNIERSFAESSSGTPCRVSLEDAKQGDEVLLLSFAHLDADSPYAASGPIFVRRRAAEQSEVVSIVDRVPEVLGKRLLSVRAYDSTAYVIDAEVCEGARLDALIRDFFDNPETAYLHVHIARRGCFAARVERADARHRPDAAAYLAIFLGGDFGFAFFPIWPL